MNQWNRTESSQINPHIYGQSIINQTEYRKKSDGEIVVFSTSGAGTPRYTHANQWILSPDSRTMYWKWIKDLKVRAKTIKILEEIIGASLHELCNHLLHIDTKSTGNQRGKNRWIVDITKIKSFWASVHTVNKVKNPPTEWEKEFPFVDQQKRTRLGSMRMWVWSLASLSGLRIQCCSELWRRLQKQLGSCVTLAVAVAGSCSSVSTPNLGTCQLPYATPVHSKRKKGGGRENICK